ncbi:uncharacterized protein N7515_006546 [Penicillium bovifimosum]|uniref:Mid2 domain-containing protein n=1 Tax=Penicillium bovifimosum TaxID=126998 RepID=A0A9W9GUY0_9EURO|nr:uncharacterized protein N7515_006546 [Penicillium bovifimosum]KAJ5130507.1 hypothetical protein N7515_006546 [Penicillium bovifimosum]
MAHTHYRHSRIGRLINAKRRLQAELLDDYADTELFKKEEPSQDPTIPPSDILPDGPCDMSKDSLSCLQHDLNEPNSSHKKREETTVTSSEKVAVETVLKIVDASSHILFQSTATHFPMTISDSIHGTYTLPSSESLTATGTATASTTASASGSTDIPTLVSPTLASPTETPAPPAQTSIPPAELTTSLLPDTSSSNSSVIPTQPSLTSANQVPSALRSATATVIHSPGWTSTPLVGPASSTSGAVTSPQAHFWSYSGPSTTATSTFDSSTYSTYDVLTSSLFTSSESTGTAIATESAPTASVTHAAGSGTTTHPDTPKIVGGVVGSVAGMALILLLLLYFLRRRGYLMGKNGRPALLDDAAAGVAAGGGAREITERRESNTPLFTASNLAPALMRRWRQSTATSRSGSTFDSAPSERGFQKIAGRKIPPVFTHGGDGYGGGLDGDSPTVPGFPPMSPPTGPMGSPTSHAAPPTSPFGSPLDSAYTREFEEHTPSTRPNPVHLPMSSAVNAGVPITVTPAQPVAQPQSAAPFVPPRPDGLGRSLHSYDGSRGSRFTESLDL